MAPWLAITRTLVGRSRPLAVAVLSLALMATPAFAVFPGNDPGGGGGGGGGSSGGGGGTPGTHGSVPEIGLGAAASALTLLVGVTLIALDRRRHRSAKVEPQQA
jgi:hypothetical protein